MITTLQGVIDGLMPPIFNQKTGSNGNFSGGAMSTAAYATGDIGAMTAPSSGVAGNTLVGWASGALPFNNPASGETVLARAQLRLAHPYAAGSFLIDRLWHNSGLDRTLTTAQTVNSVAWPARDVNGSSNGEGVVIGVETSATMGTGAPTISMSYTNSAGTAGRTASNIALPIASTSVSVLFPMALQAGDTGVQSIQNVTFSASWGTLGSLSLVAYRVLACMPTIGTTGAAGSKQITADDVLSLGAPRIPDNAFLQLWGMWSGIGAASFGAQGHLLVAQG